MPRSNGGTTLHSARVLSLPMKSAAAYPRGSRRTDRRTKFSKRSRRQQSTSACVPSSTRASNADGRKHSCGKTWIAPRMKPGVPSASITRSNQRIGWWLGPWNSAGRPPGTRRAAQEAYDRFQSEKPIDLAHEERLSLEELSRDIPALWRSPETTSRQRQEIVRCLVESVTIAVSPMEQQVEVVIRWAGGHESRHEMRRTVCSYEELDDFESLQARIAELRRPVGDRHASPSSSTLRISARRNSVRDSPPKLFATCSRVWGW